MRVEWNGRLRWLRRQGWLRLAAVAVAAICLVAIALRYAPLYASKPTQPLGTPRPQQVSIPGELPPALAWAQRLGPQDDTTPVALSIGLRLANPGGLRALLANQGNPRSPAYHHYLSPQQFAQQFAPSAVTVAAVQSFLQAAGLRVTSVAPNRLQIDATGSAAQVEQAFGVTLGSYQLGARTFYAPDHDPTLPAGIAPYILNIGGLDTLFHMVPHDVIKPHSAMAPRAASPVGYTPTDLRGAYDVTPLLSAMGSTGGAVGVFELAPYLPADITTYRTQFGLPNPAITGKSVDGAAVTGDKPGTGEADLDIEVVSALAPNATQYVYTGPNTPKGINDTYNALTSNGAYRAITTSWGVCEPFAPPDELTQLHTYLLAAQAQGTTVFAAAGDSGSDDCNSGGDAGFNAPPAVDSPASDPLAVGVGGTSLTLSGGAYGAETTWNNASGSGGGGLSDGFGLPAAQTGAGVANPYAAGQREVPDVAADADPNTGYAIYCGSIPDCGNLGWLEFGGTSAAAPLWAAIYADLDTYMVAQTNTPLAAGNAVFYQLFASAQTYPPYHDVTSTTNDLDYTSAPYQGDYPATPCYDLASGMGSVDAWNMARDLAAGVNTSGGGPCPASAASQTNLIQDGGFEASPSPWQQFSSGQRPVIKQVFPHSGQNAFVGCGYPNCDDRVAQTVAIPATVHSATLSLWVSGITSFLDLTNTPPCYDHFTVTLATPDGTVFNTAQATCKLDAYGWNLESIPVTAALQAHQGQPVTLTIRGTTSNEAVFPGFYTTWYVDDVALNVS